MIQALKRCAPIAVLTLFALYSVWWFSSFLEYSAVASVDLPGHVALIDRLSKQIVYDRLFFFDPWWFGGWPAYQFYGFFSHLIAAALIPAVSTWSQNPAVDAVNLVMLTGCATLPISVFYLADAFLNGRSSPPTTFERILVALYSCVFAFWYLNQPLDFFGIGAASLWHGGLFSQVVAWHLTLLFFAALVTSISRPALYHSLACAVLFALQIITHVFAAVFCGFVWGLVFVFFSRHRVRSLFSMVFALALSAGWWAPMVATTGGYTISHREPPQGDYFSIFIREPVLQFLKAVELLGQEQYLAVELAPILFLVIVLAMVMRGVFTENSVSRAFVLMAGLAVWCFSSQEIYQYVPVGLHYYRFFSFILLLIIGLAAAHVPLCGLRGGLWHVSRIALLGVAIGAVVMTSVISLSRGRAISHDQEFQALEAQRTVLNALKVASPQGRVAFEYFKDRSLFTFLSPHYLEARLLPATGRETTNGLFIQSSLASVFVAHSLKALGLEAYRVPALEEDVSKTDRATALEQLRDVGVSHLVTASPQAVSRFVTEDKLLAKQIGQYSLVSLAHEKKANVSENRKRLVYYYDACGGVPFKYIEMFFYSTPALYLNTLLVEARSPTDEIPAGSIVLSHGEYDKANYKFILPSESEGKPPFTIFHWEDERYRVVRSVLESLNLVKYLVPQARQVTPKSHSMATAQFDEFSQQLVVDSLEPGKTYVVSYSYFPYWQAQGGELLRGMGEQIVLRPSSTQMILRFDRELDPTVQIASSTSFICFVFLVFARFFIRKRTA